MVILPKHKLIIATPPKCGTATVHKAVEELNVGKDLPRHILVRNLRVYGFDRRNFFVFCVCRNPWDRMVSFYEYVRHTPSHFLHNKTKKPFHEYVKKHKFGCLSPKPKNSHLLECSFTGEGCDKMIPFESLTACLTNIFDVFGVPHNNIGHFNKSKRKPIKEYYVTQESIDIVEKSFSNDIKVFDYTFPNYL